MKNLLERCMGLDIHKESVVACLTVGPVDCKAEIETRTFGTLSSDLQELRKWVEGSDCRFVAMESTGIYWQPVYETLEECFGGEIELLVVNARHMKNVPGKKTDMRDAEWIATLLRAGLLSSSFIPAKEIRELRHLTRYRKSVVSDITSQKNRIEKFLQSSGFRLSSFLSDIFGASGRNVMFYLCQHGNITIEALDGCLKTKTRKRINEIMSSVNGTLSEHQRKFLIMMLSHLETLERHREEVELSISDEIDKHSEALSLLCSIPGINLTAAAAIIAEIGTDMSKFPSSEHICSWAGLAPGNNESAGKKKRASIGKGNPYIKSMLCEVAWVIAGKRNTYLAGWYWRIKQQKNAKKAIVALARKLLSIIYAMLKTKKPYSEECFEERRKRSERKRANRLIHELTMLGFKIEPAQG
jgi:transposase